jgi:hypothetical protein
MPRDPMERMMRMQEKGQRAMLAALEGNYRQILWVNDRASAATGATWGWHTDRTGVRGESIVVGEPVVDSSRVRRIEP